MTKKQALRVPERKKHNWGQAVMRDCDFCQQWALTVNHNDGGSICASCCDSEYTADLKVTLETALERMEAAEKRVTELESERDKQGRHACELFDEVAAQRKRIAELEAREVKVKQFSEFQICHYGASEDYAKGYIDCQKNYNKALGAAGILVSINGEG